MLVQHPGLDARLNEAVAGSLGLAAVAQCAQACLLGLPIEVAMDRGPAKVEVGEGLSRASDGFRKTIADADADRGKPADVAGRDHHVHCSTLDCGLMNVTLGERLRHQKNFLRQVSASRIGRRWPILRML